MGGREGKGGRGGGSVHKREEGDRGRGLRLHALEDKDWGGGSLQANPKVLDSATHSHALCAVPTGLPDLPPHGRAWQRVPWESGGGSVKEGPHE